MPSTHTVANLPDEETAGPLPLKARALLASIFVIAACGLIYKLLIATVSSYLLGSSVTQFSLSIGIFIGAMGLGSHLSQRIRGNLLAVFINVEILLGLIGGVSVCLLFFTYSLGSAYWLTLYAALLVIGGLTGLELPLLTRLLKPYGALRKVIAPALSFDYVGALVGSVLFPLLLLPSLGLARTGFVIGLLNIAVAAWNTYLFRDQLRRSGVIFAVCGFTGAGLLVGFVYSLQVISLLETNLYEDEIVYTAQTPYQRIVITRWADDMRLFLDGNLQFSSADEYRYHEALVHPAMSLPPVVEKVLVLGGGDGLGVREILKHRTVKQVTLVDIDPRMTELGRTYPAIVKLNGDALNDPRVKVVHQDAYKFLENGAELYDVIIADLPDPNTDVLAKLFSVQFYKMARRHLTASGVLVVQATSPFFARQAFWCIEATLRAAGFRTAPYHTYVPTFGDWGFVLASRHAVRPERAKVTAPTRYLTPELLPSMFVFSRDADRVPVRPSSLDHPTVLEYYVRGWKQWDQ